VGDPGNGGRVDRQALIGALKGFSAQFEQDTLVFEAGFGLAHDFLRGHVQSLVYIGRREQQQNSIPATATVTVSDGGHDRSHPAPVKTNAGIDFRAACA
jgi:hypothetical protein